MVSAMSKKTSRVSFLDWRSKVGGADNGTSLKMLSSSLRNCKDWTPPPTREVFERLDNLMGRRASKTARQEDANKKRDAEDWRESRHAPETHAEMSPDEVLEELRACNSRKAQGQDDVPAFVLKGCAEELAPWLSRFFRALCNREVVPHQWLKGRTILLAKNASGTPSGYRPVTLLSRVRILFEKLLLRRVRPLMPTHHLQGGFNAGHRCHHWAGILHDALRDRVVRQRTLLVVTLDCSAAFDTVSHEAIAEGVPRCRWRNLLLNLVEHQRLRIHGTDH